MADVFQIPLKKYPRYRQEITLDESQYIIDIIWNERGEFWFFDLYDRDEAPLVLGVKMVLDFDLLLPYSVAGMPTGSLILLDTTGSFERATYEDIEQFTLGYVTDE